MNLKTKIALIGFGKMGREIDALCRESENFEVVSVSYKNITDKLDLKGIAKADVAIDFTSKDIVLENIEKVSRLGINMVIGTTGWHEDLDSVKKIVKKYKTGLLYGQNFSAGANIFFKITAFAAGLFAKFSEYDAYGMEIHHKAKLDSPSGTALKIRDEIKKNSPYKINFTSIRAGRNPGFHEVVFDSPADGITLSHQAYNRTGFAKGALLAALFLKNKKGVYSFEDALK
ncbi:dihydrodipicolinate reductase [Candidatus Nomurabacteria bacterium]|nr:dihydrodipicolinate reductase [Candidatus Nomurabacteria bacterium]